MTSTVQPVATPAATDPTTTATSMRLPAALRDAAAIAVDELGLAASTTALAAEALRTRLEVALTDATLERHYAKHPDARPTLAEVAAATAEIDGRPIAQRSDLIDTAATAILEHHPDATPDDVLLWAEALATSAA